MTEAKAGGLYAALAKFQAALPKVGKEGEGQYGKYARLEDVSHAALPLLGELGLSFIARPTLHPETGHLVLAYSLVHTSGEREDGFYPLVANGTPQQIGGAITYARRYALCAVTGLAPDGDDDDGHSAQQAAEQDWRSAPPVQPRQRFAHTDAEHERLVPGQSAEDRSNGKKAERVKGKAPDDEWTTQAETDPKWYAEVEAEIRKFTTDEYGEVLRRRVVEKVEAEGCTKEDGEKLRTLIRARRQALAVEVAEPEPAEAS
jgi:hypothetical protein